MDGVVGLLGGVRPRRAEALSDLHQPGAAQRRGLLRGPVAAEERLRRAVPGGRRLGRLERLERLRRPLPQAPEAGLQLAGAQPRGPGVPRQRPGDADLRRRAVPPG